MNPIPIALGAGIPRIPLPNERGEGGGGALFWGAGRLRPAPGVSYQGLLRGQYRPLIENLWGYWLAPAAGTSHIKGLH